MNPGISGVFLKTGPGTPLGVAPMNLNLVNLVRLPILVHSWKDLNLAVINAKYIGNSNLPVGLQ